MALPIESVILDLLTLDPVVPENGQLWYNTTEHRLKFHINGTTYTSRTVGNKEAKIGVINDKDLLRFNAGTDQWEYDQVAAILGDVPTVADVMQVMIGISSFILLATYTKIRSLIFGGTGTWGSIANIHVLTAQTGIGGKTHDIRIYDVTNGNTIVEQTGLLHTVPTIVDMGTVSNLSSGPAIWEVQVRRGGGSHQLDFDTLTARSTG
jgi:hypothetical protein